MSVACYRYERPIDTAKELADSDVPWGHVHDAWVWSLLDSDDPISKTLVRHFRVLTENEMTALMTRGQTAFPVEKLAGGRSTADQFANHSKMWRSSKSYIHEVKKGLNSGNELPFIKGKVTPVLN
jgi:hypothetical protein